MSANETPGFGKQTLEELKAEEERELAASASREMERTMLVRLNRKRARAMYFADSPLADDDNK